MLNTSPVITPRAGRKYSSRRYAIPFDIHARLMGQGWEFIDDIIWRKPETSAKNRISNFAQHRKPLTYKPNCCTEYLMVYRRRTHRLIDWNLRQYDEDTVSQSLVDGEYERSNVWDIAPASSRVHSAVFPLRLCREVIRLYSFLGDLVFDPFAGSGTVAEAASVMGRHYFLSEINRNYADAIVTRMGGSLIADHRIRRFDIDGFRSESQRNAEPQ